MSNIEDLRDCRHYATLLCARRIMMNRIPTTLTAIKLMDDAANTVHINADPAIYAALDTIKRVMEIDETVDQPGTVLMHAGIAMHQQADDAGEPS